MATLGFLRRDFEVFAIKDVDARLAKIDELVTPRLMVLFAQFNLELARRCWRAGIVSRNRGQSSIFGDSPDAAKM